MKKLLTLGAGIFFSGILAAQWTPVPNGGFENWNTTKWMDPQYYNTSNDQRVPQESSPMPNVTRVSGKYNNYGVQVKTLLSGTDTIGGFMINANANGNNSVFPGGAAYSQEPTGVRFWYKYSTPSADTAAVLVIFKKNFANVDSFLILIPSTEQASSYTLHTYRSPGFFFTAPDTVILAVLSSISEIGSNNTKKGQIPGSTITIDSVTFTGVTTQPAQLNGNFETWVTDSVITPTDWYAQYPTVTRTTDASVGTYAIQLETVNSPNNGGPEQGQVGTGYYPQNCNGFCKELGGNAYTPTGSGKDTLRFAYKYAPVSTDTATVYLSFIHKGQNVYGSQIYLYGTNATYKDTTLGFDLGSQQVDTVMVTMQSSWHNNFFNNSDYAPYVGTIFKVDNMYFKSQPLGVPIIASEGGIKVYPNPTNSQLNVDLSNTSGSLKTLAIYDMSGRILNSQTYADGTKNMVETINVSSYTAGIYLVEVTTSTGKFYQKVCKQ